jgi:hypothetical protein
MELKRGLKISGAEVHVSSGENKKHKWNFTGETEMYGDE